MKLPLWVRACDAIAVAAGLLALSVFLFGGLSTTLGPLHLSARSPVRALFVCVALLAIRHAAFPERPLHRRILEWAHGTRSDAPAMLGTLAAISRVAVLVAGYFAVVTIGLPKGAIELSGDPILNLPMRFDAGWYGGIAQEGYSFQGRFDRQQNVAFFPAFPMLMRAGGYLTGAYDPALPRGQRLARFLWAGVFLSIVAFVWGAAYLVRLARDTIGDERAPAALALLAAYPFAAFYSAPYTESLFLLGAVAAFFHFRRGELARAAAWGLLVGLTRPNGCLLSVPLGMMAVDPHVRELLARRSLSTSRLARALASAAAPGIGMLIYSAYVRHLTGQWFGWARLHETWGRTFEGLAPLFRASDWIQNEGLFHVIAGMPFDAMNAIALIFVLVMVWPVWRRLGAAWAVLLLVTVVPPFLAGGVLSMGRVTATLFPVFLALAAMLPRRAVTPMVTAFAIGQGLVAVLFFTWLPMF